MRSLLLPALVAAVACGVQPLADVPRADDALPLHLFAYDRDAPLDVRVDSAEPRDAATLHRVSFASPRGGRVTGILVAPRRAGRHPAVVLQHGMPQRAEEMVPWAERMAARGLVVLALDAPFARRAGGPLSGTPQDSVEQVQLIVDLQRAVDLLRARADVDPARIGYVGYSYGAAMGALLAAVEARLAGYVLIHGDGGLVSHGTGPDDPPDGPPGVSPDRWRRWLAAMRPIEPLRFVGARTRVPMLLVAARHDELVPVADARALHDAVPAPKEVVWYESGHDVSDQALQDVIAWLVRTL